MKILLATVAALALAGPAAAAEFVTNGGFETGTLAGWTGPTGNTSFSSVVGGAHTGAFAYSNGAIGSFGTISQVLATQVGRTYSYSFYLLSPGGTPNAFSATLGSSTLASFTNAGAFGYTLFTGMHVATAANETLSFSFRQDPSFWRLDDVSVTGSIPEPSNWAMLIAGFGLVGAAARRRRVAVAA
jgi:hypothetical protein